MMRELIGRPLDGDEDAFVEVVRRHETAVAAYLSRRVDAGPGLPVGQVEVGTSSDFSLLDA